MRSETSDGADFNCSTTMSEHEVEPYQHAATIPGRSLSKRVRLREIQKLEQKGTSVENEETWKGILFSLRLQDVAG
jgi:hypothetical protein